MKPLRVGLVSDTHGLLDPRLEGLFEGCARVLHAGDVVRPAILDALARIAPVTAVRGNNDLDPAFARLPETALVTLGELHALVLHDLGTRARPRAEARTAVARAHPEIVVHGHSHRPGASVADGTLYVNPGSAGPRRFSLPRTAAILVVTGRHARVEFFDLSGDAPAPHGAAVEADL